MVEHNIGLRHNVDNVTTAAWSKDWNNNATLLDIADKEPAVRKADKLDLEYMPELIVADNIAVVARNIVAPFAADFVANNNLAKLDLAHEDLAQLSALR